MTTKTLTKSEFLKKESLEQLYDECKIWLSEIELCIVDLKFIQDIFDEYYSDMTTVHKLGELNFLKKELNALSVKLNNMQKKLMGQEKQVFEIIENAFSHDEQAFRDEHENLQGTVQLLQIEMKELKKKVFLYSEEVMKKKKKREKIFIS